LSTANQFERIFANPLPLNDPLSVRKRARLTDDVAPGSVQGVVNAIVASIDFINAEPNKAAEMWSKEIGFPVEVINYSLNEGISIYSRNVV
jgi:ABC-type nitrate/sulfonate/bicarbonate transport system substrate-binding protein